jgi:hypothetical protein
MPSARASRAPGLLANAIVMVVNAARSGGLWRACGVVNPGICFGEGPLWTVRVHVADSADRKPDGQWGTGQRRISQAALVSAMHAYRLATAARTHRAVRCRPGHYHEGLRGVLDPFYLDAAPMRQE